MENFDLKKYLYNKSLLTEGLDLKASPMEGEVEETTTKMSKSALKEKIRGAIMDTLSEEDTMDEKVGPGHGAGFMDDDFAKRYFNKNSMEDVSKDELVYFIKNHPHGEAFSWMLDMIKEDTMDEAEDDEAGDDLDAALDAAEDEVGDEAPANDIPSDEPAGPELSDEAGLSDEETDIQSNLKKAYDNAVSIGDEKLANQIANTITFFTRAHVVPRKD